MKARFCLFLGSYLAFFSIGAEADPLPDPGQAYVESFQTSLAGCPRGSTSFNLSPDRQALTILFDNYVVEGGSQSPSRQANAMRQCLINLRMHVPAGYSFSIINVDFRGYAGLQQGTNGVHRVNFKWAQSPMDYKRLAEETLRGPFNNDYQLHAVVPFEAMSWSPCTKASQDLAILSQIAVSGRNGFMAVDSFDASVGRGGQMITYGIGWRRCTDPGAGFPILRLGTSGDVARNTSICLNFKTGQLTLATNAPNRPGQPYARLTHYGTAVTGQTREVKRDSYGAQRTDIYAVPGDWNSIYGVNPQVTVRAAVASYHPRQSVVPISQDTTCVQVLDAPAHVSIHWNPLQ